MGCDSHPVIEKRQKNGRWVVIDDKTRYWAALRANDYENEEGIRPSFINVLGNRNYTMFAVLADVRNEGIEPLFANRGLPEDAATRTRRMIPDTDHDLHSHTYFTVKELLDTDWDAVAQTHGQAVLYAKDFQSWLETGKVPDDADDYAYAGTQVTKEEMTMLLMSNSVRALTKKQRMGKTSMDAGQYVVVPATRTYRQLVPNLVACIPDLAKLGTDPEGIRVVLAFDN